MDAYIINVLCLTENWILQTEQNPPPNPELQFKVQYPLSSIGQACYGEPLHQKILILFITQIINNNVASVFWRFRVDF